MRIVEINKAIFREYDIRGIYGEDINPEVSYTLGRSFGSYIEEKKVIVGYDNRKSSPKIRKSLVKGLMESGCEVIDIGLVTTPMYYFAKKEQKVKNGIMITASHNPKEYNGFKISFDLIGNAYGETIQKFMVYTNKLSFEKGKGFVVRKKIEKGYINLIKKSIEMGPKKIKFVVDCGNGTGSIIIKKIAKQMKLDCRFLYCKSDSNFPNHQPDPAVFKNQIDLSKKVKEYNCDFGFSIDGDADRVGFVNEKGEIIPTDLFMIIIYRDLVDKIKEKKAIYDVKCSNSLIDDLDRMGYIKTMYRTGNSYMNMKINKENYMFGGEFSGHVWFKDRFPGFDDGIYAGLRMLEILSKANKTMSDLLLDYNKYYSTEEIKIEVSDDKKFVVVDKIKQYCDDKKYTYSDIDGVRVEFNKAWALVRASNTGPNIIVRFEAPTKEELEKIQTEFMDKIKACI